MKNLASHVRQMMPIIFFNLCVLVIGASAATFTVNLTTDAGDLTCDATCTLRDALDDSNNTAGTDTIVFDAGIFGAAQTITLTSDLVITNSVNSNVNITGPGANLLTVSGGGASKIFTITETPVVSISGMTLTNGNSVGTAPGNTFGGAVYNQGDLTLTNVIVTGNTSLSDGGGLYNSVSDSMTLNNCVISNNISNSDNNTSGNGGGLHSEGGSPVLNVSGSVFSNNTAQNGRTGGGLQIDGGTITITNSTFSGNTASSSGGGISMSLATVNITGSTISGNISTTSSGGGISLASSTLTLTNSTISGNSASTLGGGLSRSGSSIPTIVHSTIVSNTAGGTGGGIYSSSTSGGTVNLGNTILGNNTAPSSADFFGTSITSQGYNLFETTPTATIIGDTTGNITGQDPLLDVLGNYGGPTMTHGYASFSSPAIDAGSNPSALTTDQRGFSRTFDDPNKPNAAGGDGTDIGAFEQQSPSEATVSVSGRVLNPEGYGLRNAIVTLADMQGVARSARTSTFGYFRFDDVAVGETYVIGVSSKRYQFTSQVIAVNDEISDLILRPETLDEKPSSIKSP